LAQGNPAAPVPPPAGPAHAVVEQRIVELRRKLKITPSETKAFDDFAAVMRDNANRMEALMKEQAPKLPKMSAVDQMQAYEAVTQEQANDIQRLVPAFTRLYDELSPEQKKIADEQSRAYMRNAKRRGS